MHTAHIIAVSAVSAEEAQTEAELCVAERAWEDNGGWSDWWEVGGRWQGYFNGENTLNVTQNVTLAEQSVQHAANLSNQEWQWCTANLTGTPGTAAPNEGTATDDPDIQARTSAILEASAAEWQKLLAAKSISDAYPYALSAWYAKRLYELASGYWCPDSFFYNAESGTAHTQPFLEDLRNGNLDENTWLVIVDLHY